MKNQTLIGLGAMLSIACGGGVDPSSSTLSSDALLSATRSETATKSVSRETIDTIALTPPTTVQVNGRTFTKYDSVADLLADPKVVKMDISIPIEEMDVHQLANAMSPVHFETRNNKTTMYYGGPDLELAQRMIDGRGKPGRVPGALGRSTRGLSPFAGAARLRGSASRLDTTGLLNPGSFGLDPNVIESPDWLFNPSNPDVPEYTDYRTNASARQIVYEQFQIGSKNWTCTGVYVGSHADTLLTAAHCLFQAGVAASNYVFTPQAVGSGSSGEVAAAPYGSFNGCFNWDIPINWVNNNCTDTTGNQSPCDSFDLGVVDFRPCGNPTEIETGSMGIEFGHTGFGSLQTAGFPGPYTFHNVGSSPPFNVPEEVDGDPNNINTQYACIPNLVPWECGMSGPVKNNGVFVESEVINLTNGDSGCPWWEVVNNAPYVAAIHHGFRTYFDAFHCPTKELGICFVNYARWIDSDADNFILSTSNL